MHFDYCTPTKIVFGRGRITELGKICRPLGTNAIIISGRTAIRKTGILNKVIDSLNAEAITFVHSENISPNTYSDEVDAAIKLARQNKSDVVIGIGGGSVLDAAKAVATGIYTTGSIGNLIGTNLPSNSKALPIIAIPTTAGTGSEVSKGAIAIDVVRKFKSGIRGDVLFPKVAIIDPELTTSLPITVARETGFDALTHAIETYVARRSNPMNDILSEKAFQLLGENLPKLRDHSKSADMEDSLCLAALLGGINVANCGTCIPHRLQQAMGSLPNINASHGQGLAIFYPGWLSAAYPFAQKKFDHIAKLLNGPNINDVIDKLRTDLHLNISLKDLGVTLSDIPTIIKNVSGAIENDPIENINDKVLESILKSSM